MLSIGESGKDWVKNWLSLEIDNCTITERVFSWSIPLAIIWLYSKCKVMQVDSEVPRDVSTLFTDKQLILERRVTPLTYSYPPYSNQLPTFCVRSLLSLWSGSFRGFSSAATSHGKTVQTIKIKIWFWCKVNLNVNYQSVISYHALR